MNVQCAARSSLLLGCGLLLLINAAGVKQSGAPFFRRWALLGAIFLFMSLDEAVELHENLGHFVDLHGVLHFSWVFVGGALFLELPLGWWTERAGEHSLGYALIDWVEGTLEMLGSTLFLLALLRHYREQHGELRLQPG